MTWSQFGFYRLMPTKPSLIDLNLSMSSQQLNTKGCVSASRSSRLTSAAQENSLTQKRSKSSTGRPKTRPAFIVCTHLKPDCLCVRRAKSQENIANTYKSKINQRSLGIKTSSPTLNNHQTKISTKLPSAPDYYSRVWSNMIEEASRRSYDVSIGNHKL